MPAGSTKAENKAASTVIDLREKINAGKRAREEAEQSSSTTTPTPVTPAASPTQPDARRQRVTRELLTSAEIQHLDIAARDAVRLQREISTTTLQEDSLRQKFEIATGRGDPATQKRIKKATVGVLYNRPVKKPVFSTDGCPLGSTAYGQNWRGRTLHASKPPTTSSDND